MARLLFFILIFSIHFPAFSATYDLGKVGPTSWEKPGFGTAAYAAASAFRKLGNPLAAALFAAEAINYLKPLLFDNAGPISLVPPGRLPVPPGWSGPNVPPSSITVDAIFKVSGYIGPDANAACKAQLEGNGYPSGTIRGQLDEPYRTSASCFYSINGNKISSIPGTITCPSGYTKAASYSNLCNLNESPTTGFAQWPPDGTATLFPLDRVWTQHPRDPDPMPSFSNPTTGPLSSSNGKPNDTFTRKGADPYGNPVEEKMTTTPDGGWDWQRIIESVNELGETFKRKDIAHIAPDGQVGPVASSESPGNLAAPAPTPTTTTLPTTVPAPTASDYPVPLVVPSPVEQRSPVVIPSPSTHTATATVPAGKDAVDPNDNTKPNNSTGAGTCDCVLSLNPPEAPTFLDSLRNFWNGMAAAPLLSILSFDFQESYSCPSIKYDFTGSGVFAGLGVLETTIHCQILQDNSTNLTIIVMALFYLTAIFIFLDA